AYPDLKFDTPSGKIDLFSDRAAALGFSPLPVHDDLPASSFPLTLRQGRTLTHFHGFYDHGRALPTLAKADPEPELWIAPDDAAPFIHGRRPRASPSAPAEVRWRHAGRAVHDELAWAARSRVRDPQAGGHLQNPDARRLVHRGRRTRRRRDRGQDRRSGPAAR